jgi:hypothetical protein
MILALSTALPKDIQNRIIHRHEVGRVLDIEHVRESDISVEPNEFFAPFYGSFLLRSEWGGATLSSISPRDSLCRTTLVIHTSLLPARPLMFFGMLSARTTSAPAWLTIAGVRP